jgi:hypothetical protein
MDILITRAFTEQNTDIGWLPLLQGKISKYWMEAYKASLPKSPHTTNAPYSGVKKLFSHYGPSAKRFGNNGTKRFMAILC